MCLEIWNMRIAVSNVVSEYSLGGVYFTHRVRDMMFDRGTGYAVCCTQCEAWVMFLEIWNMRIAVSNVVSEYSLGGVSFTHRVRYNGI